jgi:hypothetical protein
VTIDGVPDAVPTGELSWELAQGPPGSLTVAHRLDTDIPDFEQTSIYVDDTTPPAAPCTGDREARGTSGPSIQNWLPRTDPTPRGGSGTTYRLTSYRSHFYDPPGIDAAAAVRRSEEAATPLAVSVSPRP